MVTNVSYFRYRCAHCPFIHSDQAKVVTHAKSCPNVSIPTPEKNNTFSTKIFESVDGTVIEILPTEEEETTFLEKIVSEEDLIDVSELGEGPRGRGRPLWSDAKTKVLLSGILQNVHLFSDDIKATRRAWKFVGNFTREVSCMEICW